MGSMGAGAGSSAGAGGGLLGSAMQAIYQKKMYDIKQADTENIFEAYIKPYLDYEQRTFWPIGEELRPIIHERLGERPEDFFKLEERIGREAIGRRTGEGVRLARETATQGRMGSGSQAEMISQIVRGGAESEAELARNLVLARTGEEKARIGEAMAFAGRPGPPPTQLLSMAGGGPGSTINWGNIVQGMGQDAEFWTGFAQELATLRGRQGTSQDIFGGGGVDPYGLRQRRPEYY